MNKLWSVVLVMLLAVVHVDADAKRMGGGKSAGQQSSNVTQRQATPPANQQAAPAQQAQRPATAAPQAAPKKPWGAMLGGLAAGLGLAWLAHSLGMGEAFANMLLIGLAIMAVLAIVGFVMRKKAAAGAQSNNSPFAFQGAGNVGNAPQAPESAPMARQYNPEKVGNDASARPWEHAAAPVAAAAGGTMIGSALGGSQSWGVPDGFDTQGFLDAAKRNFVTLQSAWDRGDVGSLRAMMTDDMLNEVKGQLSEREEHRDGVQQPNHTDVVTLDAQLLGIEDTGNAYMASVEFSGMIREEANAGPSPFREVWNMTKPKDGASGWLVAGLQALQ